MFRSAYCAAALLLLAACSGNKDPDPTPASSMSWTVDGSTVTASSFQSQKNTTTIDATGVASPNQTANTRVALSIPPAVGTYTFGPSAVAAGTYVATTGSTTGVYYAGASGMGTVTGAGTIVVTAASATSITGTFTFTGIDRNTGASKQLTNGKFSLLL